MSDVNTRSTADLFDEIRTRAQSNIDDFGWLNVDAPDALMQIVQANMDLGKIVRDLATTLRDADQ